LLLLLPLRSLPVAKQAAGTAAVNVQGMQGKLDQAWFLCHMLLLPLLLLPLLLQVMCSLHLRQHCGLRQQRELILLQQ
jgi:hypothetical protein